MAAFRCRCRGHFESEAEHLPEAFDIQAPAGGGISGKAREECFVCSIKILLYGYVCSLQMYRETDSILLLWEGDL